MMNLTGGKIGAGAIMAGLLWQVLLLSCSVSRKPARVPASKAAVAPSVTSAPDGYADSLFVAAMTAKLSGNTAQALKLFSVFLALKPRSAAGYYQRALIKGGAGDAAGVLADARKAIRLAPDNSWYAVLYGNALAMNKTFDSAAMVFGELARNYPHEDRYLYNEAVMLSDAGDYAASLALFDTLEHRLGVNEEFVFQKQRLFLKLHQTDSAAAEIGKLITTEPANARYYGLLAQVYADAGRTSDAINVYRSLLARYPDNPQAMVAVGLFYKKEGDDSAYRSYLSRAFSNPEFGVDDKIAFMYPYLKYVEVDSTRRGEALALCRMILKAHPRDPRVLALYGDMYLESGMADSAMTAYRQSQALSDTLYEVWNQMMLVYATRGENDSLARMSAAAVVHFPDRPEAWYYHGMSLFLSGKTRVSTAALKRALRLRPPDKHLRSRIYSTLGEAYQDLGRYPASDSCFRTALALNPEDDLVLNNYSYHLAERNQDLPEALKMIREAVRIKPGRSSYEDTYAWVLYKLGRYEEAREWMEKALQVPGAAGHPGYLEHYGDILYRNHDSQGALANWKRAREAGGRSPLLDWKIAKGKLPGLRKLARLKEDKTTAK